MSSGQRRLAAIMFTDLAGYTALGQRDEALSLVLAEQQRKIARPILEKHGGREVKTMGDGSLVEFPNALDAVRCAYDIQRSVREFNFSVAEAQRIRLRVGIHLGDVVLTGGDMSGDAVNIASRIEPLAEEGGVCMTREVYEQVENKIDLPLLALGKKELKNVSRPVEVYRILLPWESERGRGLDARRVAVLPFANMSPDPNDEYFADGLTEELISTMSKVGELSVVSRTSVMQYKSRPKSAVEIGKELNAGTILEGSVRKAGGRIRVTVQTIDASKDAHLWTQSYDRDLQDVFAIQGDIAEKVADALRVHLLSSEKEKIERKPTENIEAYQLFLKGRFHFYVQTRAEFDTALENYEKALALDPGYALAYVGESDVYHVGMHYGWFTPEEANPKMKALARKAIEINPGLAEAHACLGAAYFHYDWDWKEAEKEYKKAIELKPSYENVYEMYSWLLTMVGRYEEARQVLMRGAALPPEYPSIWLRAGYSWGGGSLTIASPEETVEMLERLVKAYPDFAAGHESLGFAHYRASNHDAALSELRTAVELSKGDLQVKGDLALLLAYLGRKEEASVIYDGLLEAAKGDYVSDAQLACIAYSLGRTEEAFDYLKKAFRRRSVDLPDIKVIPEMKGLRADPRWLDIEERMGLRS